MSNSVYIVKRYHSDVPCHLWTLRRLSTALNVAENTSSIDMLRTQGSVHGTGNICQHESEAEYLTEAKRIGTHTAHQGRKLWSALAWF